MRGFVALVVAAVPFVVAVPVALAGVGFGVTPTFPSMVTVGNNGVPGSIQVINSSTPPENGGNVTINSLNLVPACASTTFVGNGDCPPASADPGVVQFSATGIGELATACAGQAFAIALTDPSTGQVTFTPNSGPIVLTSPSSANSICRIDFTFNVLKAPTKPAHPSPPNTVATWQLAFANGTAAVNGNTGVGSGSSSMNVAVPPVPAFAGVSVFRPSEGGWYFNSPPASAAYGATGDIPVPGDYDGDAMIDMAVYRPSVGTWYIHHSAAGTDALLNYGVSTDIPVPASYDGTGKTNIAVYRPSTGTWYIRNTNGTDTIVTFGGLSGDIAVPGDWEGNGKADLAIYRPSSGTWSVRLASGVVTSTSFGGQTGDIPVPGDYDGDGKTDMAIYRPSVGTWYIHNSATNTDRLLNYGVGTDQPVPGDYQRNGKTDVAIFRPSSGGWYIRNADGSDTVVTFGLAADEPLPLAYAIGHNFF